ncbi:MAG TPA: stage II sporulation protein R [Candidatus Merdivicinus excrementipullorum]|uniref:Stage II sporulation protein R n=1 Tax=Candidatus Merdivicinus excrementipullorum TaxID=2840867 RepID=A0A9D1FQ23_9FIRM|nr:stage II sporulation protein R [Candidatus Merdivicinus excrementipullorum]
MTKHSEKFWILTITLTFLLMIAFDSLSLFQKECREIQEDVLRLHILANSNSEEDQAVKLKVRDRILLESGELFNTVGDKSSAQEKAAENTDKVEQIAKEVLAEEGFSYPVTAKVTRQFFDTRVYDGFTMPAGWYDSLQVVLGEGAGRNWWCVLYPPLCISAAEKTQEKLEENFTEGERQVLESEPKYEVRFFIVELAGKIGNWLGSLND